MESSNLKEETVLYLKQLFPQCFTEEKIDFEKLKKTLGEVLDSNDEKYSFQWAGRNNTFKNIQATSKGTLVPDFHQSIHF